jgi:hypothetical protein
VKKKGGVPASRIRAERAERLLHGVGSAVATSEDGTASGGGGGVIELTKL